MCVLNVTAKTKMSTCHNSPNEQKTGFTRGFIVATKIKIKKLNSASPFSEPRFNIALCLSLFQMIRDSLKMDSRKKCKEMKGFKKGNVNSGHSIQKVVFSFYKLHFFLLKLAGYAA